MTADLVRVEVGPTGPRAVVVDGPPVWQVVVEWRRTGGDADATRAALGLDAEPLAAALAYARTHRAEVERDLAKSSPEAIEAWRRLRGGR